MNKTKLLACSILVLCIFSKKALAQFDNSTLVVRYDSAWVYKNLKLIPVRYQFGPGDAPIDKNARIVSLAEVMQKGEIKISELPKNVGADVSTLKIKNESKDYVLINSGEVIMGGKQDRAVGETVLIPPDKEDYFVKTYCVEKGRWSKKEKRFTYYRPAELLLKKIIDIEKNQAHVWNEIESRFKSANVETDSWAYPEIINRNTSLADTGYIRFFREKFSNSDSGYAGFVAVTDSRIIATDLYATSQLTSNAFEAILHTYVKYAVQAGDTPILPDASVSQFMEPILGDAKTRREFLAKHGTTHYFKGRPIHIVAYGN